MYYTVYKVTNLVNGKIYIGVHKTVDLDDGYMGSGEILKRSQNKYGLENFQKEILEVFDNPEEMFSLEAKLVDVNFVKNNNTYNLKEGGYGGFDFINTAGLNNSAQNNIKGGLASAQSRIDNPERFEEGRRKASERFIKMHQDGEMSYDNFKGKTHSDITIEKMKESHKGKHVGEKNSQFGTMWIYSLDDQISKKIKKEDFPEYEAQGWLKGRKIKF